MDASGLVKLRLFPNVSRNAKESILWVLSEASPELPSILQMFLDEYQNKGRLKVVLCGSSISFMEGILSYANPLYGRNTMKLRLLPVTFDNAREFIPRSDFHRLLEVYSVIGGIPMYLNLWDENKSVFENILQLFLEVGAPLREEPIFILMSELREPRIYQSILEALSMGRNTPSEISSYVGFSDSRKIQPYLRKLEELSIVRRTLPALLKNPRKTRKIRYEIADQLFRFWYRFVFPNVDRLEVGDFGSIIDTLKEGFDQYVSFEFERQAMMETARVFNAIRFGKFWNKWEELDFLGETKEGLIVGEFKWWRRRVGLSVLYELKRKCRKLSIEPICYILASREGFEKELFKEKDVSLLVLDKNDGWKLLK